MILHTMKNPLAACALIVLLLVSAAQAQEWPQWRGPHFNGCSEATNLPDRLDPSTMQWSIALPGAGAGTPIVWQDRIFISCVESQSRTILAMCYSRKDGKQLWSRPIGPGFVHSARNDAGSPSAITDGKTVWFYYATGDLVAFDIDGKPIWARNIQKDYGPFHIQWIYGSSPLLYEGKLYVQVLHRDVPPDVSYLLAIDPQTGKDIWRHIRPNAAVEESRESYATPIPHLYAGHDEILLIGGDCVTAHDPQTGAELWRCGGWNPRKIGHWRLVTSVVADDGLVFACPPKGEPMFAIRDAGSGDVTNSNVAWKSRQLSSDVCVPLVYKGHLYVLDGDRKTISCVEPQTAKILWSGSLGGRAVFRASPTGADDKIYCMNESGDLWVLSADEFKILSQSSLGGSRTRSSIAVVNGQVIVRANDKLAVFAKR